MVRQHVKPSTAGDCPSRRHVNQFAQHLQRENRLWRFHPRQGRGGPLPRVGRIQTAARQSVCGQRPRLSLAATKSVLQSRAGRVSLMAQPQRSQSADVPSQPEQPSGLFPSQQSIPFAQRIPLAHSQQPPRSGVCRKSFISNDLRHSVQRVRDSALRVAMFRGVVRMFRVVSIILNITGLAVCWHGDELV